MTILGIDPGTARVGYGFIEETAEPKLLEYGTLESFAPDVYGKILDITRQFNALLEKIKPDAAVFEKLYFTKNQKTAMDVAQSRGILLAQCLLRGIIVREIGPQEVKQGVTGYGLADKRAVAMMVRKILRVDALAGHDDASDALAIALAGAPYCKRETF